MISAHALSAAILPSMRSLRLMDVESRFPPPFLSVADGARAE
jgi:hypothetical protein